MIQSESVFALVRVCQRSVREPTKFAPVRVSRPCFRRTAFLRAAQECVFSR